MVENFFRLISREIHIERDYLHVSLEGFNQLFTDLYLLSNQMQYMSPQACEYTKVGV